jgi:hypothetical protein
LVDGDFGYAFLIVFSSCGFDINNGVHNQ